MGKELCVMTVVEQGYRSFLYVSILVGGAYTSRDYVGFEALSHSSDYEF
jgi:hypothetical protein